MYLLFEGKKEKKKKLWHVAYKKNNYKELVNAAFLKHVHKNGYQN